MKRAAFMGLALLATGCASGLDRQQSKMFDALSPFVGKTIADYELSKGQPENVIELGPNRRGFQWRFGGQSPGAVLPIGGAIVAVPPRQLECRVTLTASSSKANPNTYDWIIESYRWDGSC